MRFTGFSPAALGLAAVMLSSVLFALKGIFIKLAYAQGVEPLRIMALRLIFCLPFFLAAEAWQAYRPGTRTRLGAWDRAAIGLLGITGYYLSSYLDFLGLQYVSAGLERLILFSYPTFVVLISAIFLRSCSLRELALPLVVSYAGLGLALSGNLQMDSDRGLLGAGLVLLSAFCYAFFMLGYGRMVGRIGAARLTGNAMLAATAAVTVHFFALNPPSALVLPVRIYLLILAIAVFSTVLPVYLLGYGVRLIGPARASAASLSSPPASFLLAWLLLGEPAGGPQLAGMVLVGAGVFLLGRRRPRQ